MRPACSGRRPLDCCRNRPRAAMSWPPKPASQARVTSPSTACAASAGEPSPSANAAIRPRSLRVEVQAHGHGRVRVEERRPLVGDERRCDDAVLEDVVCRGGWHARIHGQGQGLAHRGIQRVHDKVHGELHRLAGAAPVRGRRPSWRSTPGSASRSSTPDSSPLAITSSWPASMVTTLPETGASTKRARGRGQADLERPRRLDTARAHVADDHAVGTAPRPDASSRSTCLGDRRRRRTC